MEAITIEEVAQETDLFKLYPGQAKAQGCYIQLDARTGAVGAAYDPEIGSAVPSAVHHGHVVRLHCPCLVAGAANKLMGALAPLLERVIAGYSSEWDGSDTVARYTDDARQAIIEAVALAEDYGAPEDRVELVDAADFYGPLGDARSQAFLLGISRETTDERLDGIAEDDATSALSEMRAVLVRAPEHLRHLRDQLTA